MPKTYDRAYFQRWYHSKRRVVMPADIVRRARLALAAAEYFLQRPVRSVLDVGCGEGLWRAPLRRLRPQLRWVGVDASDYVVRRFGRRRGIMRGSFAGLGRVPLRGTFDLVVCSDVLHYLTSAEILEGLPALVRRIGGIAWIDAFTSEDPMTGDRIDFVERRPASYRRMFRDAGLVGIGMNCWARRSFVLQHVGMLEGCSAS
jgi:SAM-dependent methyltransferase